LPRPLEEGTYREFVATATSLGGVYRVMGVLLAYTGCRISELRTARWHQFDLVTAPCWYIEGKASNRRGPKTRQVPLHPEVVPILAGWRSECGSVDWLFPSPVSWASCIGATTFRKLFMELCEAADIEQCVPHSSATPSPHRRSTDRGTSGPSRSSSDTKA
jgi:integrase